MLVVVPGLTILAGAAPGLQLVAFRLDGDGFIGFLNGLAGLHLRDHRDRLATPDSVVDHDGAFSVYFSDPYGNG